MNGTSANWFWISDRVPVPWQTGLIFRKRQIEFCARGFFLERGRDVDMSRQGLHQEPNLHSCSGSIGPVCLRKGSWVVSQISVFWFSWLSAKLSLIPSFVRSGKSIVLLSKLPNTAFLGSGTSHLGHCKFNKASEAPVSSILQTFLLEQNCKPLSH